MRKPSVKKRAAFGISGKNRKKKKKGVDKRRGKEV